MKKISLIVVMAGLLFFAGKSFGFISHKVVKTTSNEIMYVSANNPAEAKFPKGEKIFKEKCVACHQLTGMGLPGAFPPLKGSDYLKANIKGAITHVLNGSGEAVTVNGVSYSIPMPPQVDNYEDAVAVVNYILNAWGNNYGTVTMAEAKAVKIVR
ncbi:MAG TPA: cytochrome c [Bacteroidetes bacterium]|nr:cytochrome c [Bacteroidota bacterium]